MLSGGIDSAYSLKKVLSETNEKLYVHHIHIKNNEGSDVKRYKMEAKALRKIVPYMKKNFRDFHYSESTIDVRQLLDIPLYLYEWEEVPYIFDGIYYYFIGGTLSKITGS